MKKEGMRLLASVRRSINDRIYAITAKKYHDSIPLKGIDDILRSEGYWLIQEDGQPWSGLLCGREANVTFDINGIDGKIQNSMLILTWYKMPSGRYEIVSYLS